MSKLHIVRGVSGSGKSTYAKSLNIFHVESDMFIMRGCEYKWKPETVKDSHAWCYEMVQQAMYHGMDVVVANTFIKLWEFEKYITLAEEYSYDVEVVTCKNNYGDIHNVPEETLQRMRNNFEAYDGEKYYIEGVFK